MEQDRLRTLERFLASIPSLLIGVDGEGRVFYWNQTAERLLGISALEVVGRPFASVRVPWDWERVVGAKPSGGESPVRLSDIRYTRPDGKEGFLGFTLNPLVEGSPGSFLLLGADITERRQLEAQLALAQKMEAIGQLAAGIAHEINTPLQYVGDNARFLQQAFSDLARVIDRWGRLLEALRSGSLTPELLEEAQRAAEEADLEYLREEIPRALEQSLEGIERVSRIVRAMKEFSHPGTEEKVETDLNKALEATLTVSRNEWKYVADVVKDLDPSLPLVPCLPGDLNQVFLNLIVNAAHAIAEVVGDGSRGKGTLTVSTRRDGGWVEVRIGDTGTGIPPEIQSKIFDPFFTTKEVGRGTGQGLAIAHSVVVEKHGGSISFASEVGRGTTFKVRLPLKASSSSHKSRRETA